MAKHLLNQSKFGGILNLFLNLRLLLNRFQPRSVTVLARPACQRPLPHCLAFFSTSHTPSLPTGSLCRLIPPVSRVASRRPRPTGLLCRATAPPPPPDTTSRGAWPPSPSFSYPHAAPSRPPPSSFFPRRPAPPSAFKSRQPPTSLPFLSIFLLHPLRALLIPSSPGLSAPSFGRLTALPPGVQATAGFDFPSPW
jgi:hypothetical protein